MGTMKIIETVLLAISAFVAAAKGVIKFIGCVNKLRAKPA